MTHSVRITEPALEDLEAIHQWISETAGEDFAGQYYQRIEERLRTLTDFPDRGTSRAELGEGIRSVPFERRLVILYRVQQQDVLILRVLHGARDLGAIEL